MRDSRRLRWLWTIAPCALMFLASEGSAASLELGQFRVTLIPRTAVWRQQNTVYAIVEPVGVLPTEPTRPTAHDVGIRFEPSRVVRHAEVLGFPSPTAQPHLELFIGTTTGFVMRFETAPTGLGVFPLGQLAIVHRPPFAPEKVASTLSLEVEMDMDAQTRAEIDAAFEQVALEEEIVRGDLVGDSIATIAPTVDPRVEKRLHDALELYEQRGEHWGNIAEFPSLRQCLTKRPFLLMLDPGHDSSDSRAAKIELGVLEYELNDRLVARLQSKLRVPGALDVVLSRGPEDVLPLADRVKSIEDAKPDLVLSIHHDNVRRRHQQPVRINGEPSRRCIDHVGFGIFIGGKGENLYTARRAGRFFSDALLASGRPIGRFYSGGDINRGVYGGGALYLLGNLNRPAVLIEMGYFCNPRELALIRSPRFVESQARALAAAVRRTILATHCVGQLRN